MFHLGGWWYDSEVEKLEIDFVEKMDGFCVEMLVGHQVTVQWGRFCMGLALRREVCLESQI